MDFDMGAYGAYVWPAWGLSTLTLAALAIRAGLAARRWSAALKRLEVEDGASASEPTP